ncbi:MAG: hypothetical protein ACQETQ_06100 [Spirochaetota bacterium]
MDGVQKAFERSIQLEQENLNTYDIYSAITTHVGLKHLLSSLMEEGRSHLAELEEFRAGMDDSLFDETKAASIGEMEGAEVEYAFDASMEYIDFLRMIFTREQALASVYDVLSGAAADRDTAHFFKRLAEDCRKHVWLAKDRYDLESLK